MSNDYAAMYYTALFIVVGLFVAGCAVVYVAFLRPKKRQTVNDFLTNTT